MDRFLKELPKVELHAHLNGSLNTTSLLELGAHLYGENTPKFIELCHEFIKFDKVSGDNLENCFKKFGFVHELTATPKGLDFATELVIRDFANDSVIYLELRTTPKCTEFMNRRQYLQNVISAIYRSKRIYPQINVKLLLSINRAESVASAEETISLAEEFLISNPDVIVGIDLSGNPMVGKFSDFTNALSKARNAGLKLALHCAEIDNAVEVLEMLEFGMSRCGHGTFLSTDNLKHLKVNNVAIECCLTSNLKSGSVSSYKAHHIKKIMDANVATMICTDDCGVFNTTLSNEFLIAANTFQLSHHQCAKLCLEAVHHSFATDVEKQELREKIQKFVENEINCN